MSKKILINKDDGSFKLLSQYLKAKNRTFLTYGLENKSDYMLEISEKIKQPLAEFNRYNFLSAYAVCKEVGFEDEEIFKAMKSFNLPIGRFQVVYDKDFTVIVDFAHTPNGMYQLLKSVKKLYPSRRIINVFGSAGHRDITKRPVMGEASGEFSDITIITEDDPRHEDPYEISQQIAKGIEKKGFTMVEPEKLGNKNKTYSIIVDRETALEKALLLAKHKDVFVFNGKGHEKSIARGDREDPWSDQETTLKLLKKLKIEK